MKFLFQYELIVETWLDPKLEYGQQRKRKKYMEKENNGKMK